MWLEKIDIQHFRNYSEASVSFSPHLNIFLGRNAQGKTNILEAIYFLALTRSHRTHLDKELIQFQQNSLKLNGIVHRHSGTYLWKSTYLIRDELQRSNTSSRQNYLII